MEGWQRAFVIHARPYSETSLLLDFFTENEGRVRILSKGARGRRSPLKELFNLLLPCSFVGVGEVR